MTNKVDYKSNHGKVGKCLYLKMKKDFFYDAGIIVEEGQTLSIEELEKFGASSAVPVVVDSTIQGDYEAVCEYGTEIHFHN